MEPWKEFIINYPDKTKYLEIVAACINKFGDAGRGYSFADWGRIISQLLEQGEEDDIQPQASNTELSLEQQILQYLKNNPFSKASKIASFLDIKKSKVNSLLYYLKIQGKCVVDSDYKWHICENNKESTLEESTAKEYIVEESTTVEYVVEEPASIEYTHKQDTEEYKQEIKVYKEALNNLHVSNREGKKAPHKSILLIAIFQLIQRGILKDNKFGLTKSLEREFKRIWDNEIPEDYPFRPNINAPFWYMQSEPFWKLYYNNGTDHIAVWNNHIPTTKHLTSLIAELDNSLFNMLQRESVITELLQHLYNIVRTGVKGEPISTKVHGTIYLEKQKNSLSRKILSKNVTDDIANQNIENSFVCISETVKSKVPSSFLKYVYDYNKDVYTCLMSILKDGEYTIEGKKVAYKIFESNFIKISRFFMNKKDWEGLSSSVKGRWASIEFEYKNEIYYITNQIDGHDIEAKHKVRINDFAIFLYEGSNHKYFINFIDDGSGYIHELRQIRTGEETDFMQKGTLIKDLASKPSPKVEVVNGADFSIENTSEGCHIYNYKGERIFNASGKLKLINGHPYRIVYSYSAYTIFDFKRISTGFTIGNKILRAPKKSSLYKKIDMFNYLDCLEDINISPYHTQFEFKFDGSWYDSRGESINK